MHAKVFTAAVVALSLPAFAAMAQSSGPARGVPDSTSATGGRVVTQGGEGVRAVTAPKDFIEQAASSDMFEIETGRMAASKGNHEAVRSFGQHMVSDHTQTTQQLMTLAARHGVAPAGTMEPRHVTMATNLRALSGPAFDQQYVQGQVLAHREAVTLFEQAAQSTSPDMADIRSFAAQTLPTLRQHLQMAEGLAGTGVPTARQQ
ncbi:MAG TPA: DUF4142 domain-containing protein [Azospirillum sp.]|nr:DUF4142 domain-containing protein [Azospirillum sp.]